MTLHINRPSSTRFSAFVRDRGCRKFRVVSRPKKSYVNCAALLARVMTRSGSKEGYVCLTADYYDPSILLKMSK